MRKYFIGIDNGSQSTKVAIIDDKGKIHAHGSKRLHPNDTPQPGVVEHPDDDIWDSIGAASRQALLAFRGDIADIVAVGLCTIRFCRAMVKADGSLAHPVLSWMDKRVSAPYIPSDWPEAAYVTTSSGYVSMRLTGNPVDTAANYQGMWPIDTDTWEWLPDGEKFNSYGYPRQMLFDLVLPGDQLGTVTLAASKHTGIPAGLPVYATSNDKAVEALGCGLRKSTDVLVSLGTYIAGMSVGEANLPGEQAFWSNFASEGHVYLYESEGIRRGMWTVSWVRDLIGCQFENAAAAEGKSVEQYLDKVSESVPVGSDGLLTILDWLAPTDQPHRKGAFIGYDGRQGAQHMFRSVLESIAMEMATKVSAMGRAVGTSYNQVIVSGGGSNSDLMMQIMADAFNMPAVRMEMNNAASLGAAICAAVGAGVYTSFAEATAAMVHPGTKFEPIEKNVAIYGELAPIQKALSQALTPQLTRLYEVVG